MSSEDWRAKEVENIAGFDWEVFEPLVKGLAGFDEDTLSEMARSGQAAAERTAHQATTGAVMSAAAQTSYAEAGQSLERVDRRPPGLHE